ncbi:glycosyltransferase [Magnetospirillum sp. 64-120]|uniref:glycosyltransferase family 2 protein n=1 Tax=Magnetospirillum sp. 64-120 TaxID=1895778 RepID=UPI0009281DEC|nr:glycosyltransferase [Magnetospirillum sp. 64-120]OJX68194.1 MAG: hypothetical protein BGO92_05945 [Magnetospirillum sp. 64-120]
MSANPLVTVYITNYNYGRYLRQAVDSVLAQQFTDYELIIVDDGSTDNSSDIIREYEGRPGIRIILQNNKGLNATNNICVRAARGKYIMRLDADDFLDENALLIMANLLEAEPKLALVFPDWYYVDAEGQITGQERRNNFQSEVTLLDQPAHGACTMIRRECLLEVGAYSSGFRCQDGYDLWLKIIDRYPVRNINLPLFYYRRHGNNLTEKNELILKTRSEILKAHADRVNRPELATLAVLPVRGPSIDPKCLSRATLDGLPLIDWTIASALEAETLGGLVVSSPDQALLEAVAATWGERVILHHRSRDQALENVSYSQTILEAMEMATFSPDALLLLNVEYPLRTSFYLDKAVNVMRVFDDIDLVLGVLPEDDLFFQHAGSGLRPVGTNSMLTKMRFERDYLYRHAGGAVLARASFYRQTRGDLTRARIGHYVLSRKAATAVRNPLDLAIAEAVLATTRQET